MNQRRRGRGARGGRERGWGQRPRPRMGGFLVPGPRRVAEPWTEGDPRPGHDPRGRLPRGQAGYLPLHPEGGDASLCLSRILTGPMAGEAEAGFSLQS